MYKILRFSGDRVNILEDVLQGRDTHPAYLIRRFGYRYFIQMLRRQRGQLLRQAKEPEAAFGKVRHVRDGDDAEPDRGECSLNETCDVRGALRGSTPACRDEVVVVNAHDVRLRWTPPASDLIGVFYHWIGVMIQSTVRTMEVTGRWASAFVVVISDYDTAVLLQDYFGTILF
jgi:hypothetical protein